MSVTYCIPKQERPLRQEIASIDRMCRKAQLRCIRSIREKLHPRSLAGFVPYPTCPNSTERNSPQVHVGAGSATRCKT